MEDLDRVKRDVEEALKKKEQELKAMTSKCEEGESKANNLNKKLKDLQVISSIYILLSLFKNFFFFLDKN